MTIERLSDEQIAEANKAASRLLKKIDGVAIAAQVQPGVVIETPDVIAVCNALLARRANDKRLREAASRVVVASEEIIHMEGDEDESGVEMCEAMRELAIALRVTTKESEERNGEVS